MIYTHTEIEKIETDLKAGILFQSHRILIADLIETLHETEHSIDEDLKDFKYFKEGFQIAVNRINALKSVLLEAIYAVRGSGHESHVGDAIVYTPQINVEMVKDWEKVLQAPSEEKSQDEWRTRTERKEGTTPLHAKQHPELLEEGNVF